MNEADTFVSRLSRRAAERPDDVAFRFPLRAGEIREITWGQLWRSGCRGANRLVGHRRIGILCSKPGDFVTSLVAVLIAGATAVPLPATLGRRSLPRIHAILRQADLDAIIISGTDEHRVLGLDPAIERIAVDELEETSATAAPHSWRSAPLLIQFTSGSTGIPQGIELSEDNVVANCAQIVESYELDSASIGVSWLPLHHDMGLVGHVLVPLWQGGLSVLIDPLRFLQRPLSWLQAVGRERATITSAPSFAYDLCARAAAQCSEGSLGLESLTTAVCGGEPIDPRTLDAFGAAFAPHGFRREAFAPSYGLAEATLLVTSGKSLRGPASVELSSEADGRRHRYTKLGRPRGGSRIRIVDPKSGELLSGPAIGEICIGGPSVGRRLGEEPKEWINTGDLGCLIEGELIVAGRIKELLIVRGENIFPAPIEAAALAADPAVFPGGTAAVGIRREGTQALVLVVEVDLPNSSASTCRKLQRMIQEHVASATGHLPDQIILVRKGSLPRSTSGKLRRASIMSQCEAGELHQVIATKAGVEVGHA
jgi:acyl-CoA synthetase (AMP-forming)/AMP-acid ligase II